MSRRRQTKAIVLIGLIVGTFFMAASIKWIYDPIGMATGGFTGIAIIIKGMTQALVAGGIPLWFTNLLLNIPLFAIGYRTMGKGFVGKSFFSTIMLSVWLYLLPEWNPIGSDFMLAAVIGGAIGGVGIGLVFRLQATTGGTDMAATLLQRHIRHYSIPQIMLSLDAMIVLVGAYTFGIKVALYAVISNFILSKVSDAILSGMRDAKVAFIITDKSEELAKAIMNYIQRGITSIPATGMYTGNGRNALYCVVSKKEIAHLKDLVLDIDEKAFFTISDATEVFGEGFLEKTKH